MIISCQFLGSSSRGNSLLLRTSETNVLIDAGLTGKQIVERLNLCGCDVSEIGAVFLTHEHMDHCQGLRGLSKFSHIQYFANAATATAISDRFKKNFHWKPFDTGQVVEFKDLKIETFSIPHDAIDPVGYIFQGKDGGKSLCWVTDLGYVPRQVEDRVKNSEILVLESNYDNILLENDIRPVAIKERIRGRYGHLSNESAFYLVTSAERPKWQKIFLAHLSRDCNKCDIVRGLFGDEICERFDITVVDPLDPIAAAYLC